MGNFEFLDIASTRIVLDESYCRRERSPLLPVRDKRRHVTPKCRRRVMSAAPTDRGLAAELYLRGSSFLSCFLYSSPTKLSFKALA